MIADQKNIVIRNFQWNARTLKDSQRMWPRKRCWLTVFSSVFLLASKMIFSAATFSYTDGAWAKLAVVGLRGDFCGWGICHERDSGSWDSLTANCGIITACFLFFFSFLSLKSFYLSVFLFASSLSLFCFDGPLSGISFHCAVAASCSADKGNDERCWTHFSFDWGIWGGVTEWWLIYTW